MEKEDNSPTKCGKMPERKEVYLEHLGMMDDSDYFEYQGIGCFGQRRVLWLVVIGSHSNEHTMIKLVV